MKNTTILIIEDEDTNQQYLLEILKKTCKKLFLAKNGQEGLKLLKEHPEMNLILLDIKLPDISGFELAGQLKTINKKIKIIAQTSYAFSEDRIKAINAGCDDYIPKPYSERDILALIRSNL
jgi:CheY-like chemotaxis protein